MFKLSKIENIHNPNLVKKYIDIAKLDKIDTLKELKTSEKGLSSNEANLRLKNNGHNVISNQKNKHWYHFLIKAILDPFIIVLLVLAVSTYLIGGTKTDFFGSIIILVIAGISIAIRFTQEYRSHLSSLKLKGLLKTKVIVRRDNEIKQIDIERIAIGDIIVLSSGSIIPSDCRIIECRDLFIAQALFTGESMPVEKHQKYYDDVEKELTNISNICLMGSTVVSGNAVAIVVNYGVNNYIGLVAGSIKEEKNETNFDRGVKEVSYSLIIYMLIITILVFVFKAVVKKDILVELLFSISVAVGLTPGMLPMIVNTNLAKGASVLAKKKTIVKNLNAIQNLGAIDTLCTDKTGTLTENRIVLQKYFNCESKEDLEVLKYAYLNSYLHTGERNVIDDAVVLYACEHEVDHLAKSYTKIDEIPFDYERRIMSVVISDKNEDHLLISKGALESILNISSYVLKDGKKVAINDAMKKHITMNVDELNKKGMHVIAVAIKDEKVDIKTFTKKDENKMTLVGYVAFLDPLKKGVKESLLSLREAGINIKILTGDGEAITKTICEQVGIDTKIIIHGSEIEEMSKLELEKQVLNCNIYVRMTPLQKNRVIETYKSLGCIVGYMGDGINDAPSLRSADVGICVDTASEIARNSSDIILLEKDLMVLKDGVIAGRGIFANIIKYMKMTLSSNFGNMFSVLVGSAFLPFLPMIPIQILIQNMLYDMSQTALPWDNVDKDFLLKPQRWDIGDLERYMRTIGIVSSVYDVITYLTLWFVLGYSVVGDQMFFQTGWFMEGLMSQTLIVYFIRTSKIPFIESRPNILVTISTLAVVVCALILPFMPFAYLLGFAVPGVKYYMILPIILIMYFITVEIVKRWYINKYHKWL